MLAAANTYSVGANKVYGCCMLGMPGTGAGQFGSPTQLSTAGFTRPPVFRLANLDGTGSDDLIVSGGNHGTLRLINNIGSLSTSSSRDITLLDANFAGVQLDPDDAVITDLDGDGRADIVLAHEHVGVLWSSKSTSSPYETEVLLADTAVSPSISLPLRIAEGDLDGDGRLDIAFPYHDSASSHPGSFVNVFLGKGGRVFDGAHAVPITFTPGDVAVGDFNGDGAPDLLVAEYSSSTFALYLLLANP
jgi:hypothetical protein